jgi:hypothetical protein
MTETINQTAMRANTRGIAVSRRQCKPLSTRHAVSVLLSFVDSKCVGDTCVNAALRQVVKAVNRATGIGKIDLALGITTLVLELAINLKCC